MGRHHFPARQDSCRESAAAGHLFLGRRNSPAMTPRSIKTLTACSWIILVVSVVASLSFAVMGPNLISQGIIDDCEKNVRAIQASMDLHQLQEIATWRTQGEAHVMASSRVLLFISVAIFLLCVICSVVSLWHLRRLRKYLCENKSTA